MFKNGFIKLGTSGDRSKVKTPKVSDERGVVYLGHVPHGFYENEMRQYFAQFGEVTNINIPKSKKTGKAQGYAFVEFMYPEVAKVVAETMNNYLMDKKILVAKYLPPDQVKSNTFWRTNTSKIPLTIKNRSIQRKAMNKHLDPEKETKCKKSLNKRVRSLQKKLKNKGIDYEIQMYKPEPYKNNHKPDNNDNHNLSATCSESSLIMESSNDEQEISVKPVSKVTKKKLKNKVNSYKLKTKT